MKASEFLRTYAHKPQPTWESAVVESYAKGEHPPIVWVPIDLEDAQGNHAIAYVTRDYLSVGETGDEMRVPLTPERAQDIANLYGAFLPTPELVYQIWRQSTKLERQAMVPNKGPNLEQYAAHDDLINEQLRGVDAPANKPLSGHKKDVVISNAYKPGKVIIFGWYKPEPDVYDDKSAWTVPNRQPQQVLSNAHYNGYADYSHGIRLVHPLMVVNGIETPTESVLKDKTLSSLVSREGPVKIVRYPARVPLPTALAYERPTTPGYAWRGYREMVFMRRKAS